MEKVTQLKLISELQYKRNIIAAWLQAIDLNPEKFMKTEQVWTLALKNAQDFNDERGRRVCWEKLIICIWIIIMAFRFTAVDQASQQD